MKKLESEKNEEVLPTPIAAKSPITTQTPQQIDDTKKTSNPEEISHPTESKMQRYKIAKVKISSAKNVSKSKAKIVWKKLADVSGYQIQYAVNKKFKKAKSKTVKSTSVTLKKLKKKKTYYIRIRAYTLADGKKVYGKWSKTKKVKVKK